MLDIPFENKDDNLLTKYKNLKIKRDFIKNNTKRNVNLIYKLNQKHKIANSKIFDFVFTAEKIEKTKTIYSEILMNTMEFNKLTESFFK